MTILCQSLRGITTEDLEFPAVEPNDPGVQRRNLLLPRGAVCSHNLAWPLYKSDNAVVSTFHWEVVVLGVIPFEVRSFLVVLFWDQWVWYWGGWRVLTEAPECT